LKISLVVAQHIPTCVVILVHLSEYLCEQYHFLVTPQISTIQFSLLPNSRNFLVKNKSHNMSFN